MAIQQRQPQNAVKTSENVAQKHKTRTTYLLHPQMKLCHCLSMNQICDPITLMRWGLNPNLKHLYGFGALRVYANDNGIGSKNSPLEHNCFAEVHEGIPAGWKVKEVISSLDRIGYSGELIAIDKFFKAERIQLHQGLIKISESSYTRNCLSFSIKNGELRMAEIAPLDKVESHSLAYWLGLLWQGICVFLPRGNTFDIREIINSKLLSDKGEIIHGAFANKICKQDGLVLYAVGMANPLRQSLVICGENSVLQSIKAILVINK